MINMTKLFDKEDIEKRIKVLAKQLDINIRGKEDKTVLLYVKKGGEIFFKKLFNNMRTKPLIDSIKVKSYVGTSSSNSVEWKEPPIVNLNGKDVIIIDDILDTGLTMSQIKNYLKAKGANNVKFCVVINKKARRKYDIEPDYNLYKIDDGFVVGFGMDYNEQYRNLEDIFIIKE